MKPQSANGVTGHLLYIHCDNVYVFRVYNADHTFVDYDLLHCDLRVTINDEDAAFYSKGGKDWLDHSPTTLGDTDE